jgi:hypothetical protein
MKNSRLNEEGAWYLETGCHSVITYKILTSTLSEPSNKALSLTSEERESDGLSQGQRMTTIHNLKNIRSN